MLGATVSGTLGTPTGSVTFMDGSAAIGNATLSASGVGTFSAKFATAGVHNLTAVYGGDSVFNASTSGVFAENVLLNPTGITVSGTPNPAVVFQTISFTADVTSSTGYVATGTVTFLANGTPMGTGVLQLGKAFFSTSSLAAGTYAITASYGGSAGASASTSAPFTLVVGPESSQVALTSSVNPALLGAAVTFTAKVTAAAGAPTGTVQFYDAGTLLGTAALNGQTAATYTTSSLTLGTHPITAVYSGDANVVGSSSGALDESVVAYVGDFSIGANPASASIYTGQAARFRVTVTSMGGFNEPVTLACAGLPAETTCNFSSTTIANGQGISTLTLQTSAPQRASAGDGPGFFGKSGRPTIALAALAFVFAGRRRRWRGWLALLALCVGLGVSSCGGPAAIAGGTPVGKYTVTVTGSYAAQGAPSLTHSTSMALNVKSLF